MLKTSNKTIGVKRRGIRGKGKEVKLRRTK